MDDADPDQKRWENFDQTWNALQEDASGQLQFMNQQNASLMVGQKRAAQATVVRGIIRQLYLVIDLGASMLDRLDVLRPSVYECTINTLKRWIVEFFDSNPIGRIGIIGLRDGTSNRLLELSGNVQDHLQVLDDLLDPSKYKGWPSLENGISLANVMLKSAQKQNDASREILVVMSSIASVDPTDIWQVVDAAIQDGIRISCVSLTAEVFICKQLCKKSGGTYKVVIDEVHLQECLWEHILPPPLTKKIPTLQLLMGFPQRIAYPSMCADHHDSQSTRSYKCPRCLSKICSIPVDCVVCGLKLISAPHLARSYHHLVPVPIYTDVGYALVKGGIEQTVCFGCNKQVNLVEQKLQLQKPKIKKIKIKLNSKPKAVVTQQDVAVVTPEQQVAQKIFKCPQCKNLYCLDCEVFVHESLHCCPGCS